METENVKVKERFELSLDGRQIASVVVGALVLLGVVFVLGLNLGRQLTVKQLEATRGDALAALDRPPPAPAGPISDDALTYHDRLTRNRPAAVEELPAKAAAAPAPAPTPAASPGASPAASPLAAAAPPSPAPSPAGNFAVQLVSTPSKAEADKLAGKLQEYDPRIETTEVTGKGRYYRVRVGAYETRGEAEKALKALATRTGGKGMVVTLRGR
jgi:septal ring-binding cell division protein DamX